MLIDLLESSKAIGLCPMGIYVPSQDMVMGGGSVHLTTLFPGQA